MAFIKSLNIYRVGLRYPVTVLLVGCMLTLLAFLYAKKLKIETDFSTLLPSKTTSVRDLETLRKNFGSPGHLFLTVEAEDPALAETFADDFVAHVEAIPTVRYVEYRRPVDYFEKRKWLFLDLEDLREMENRIDRSLELERKGVSPVFSPLMDFADEEDRSDLTFKDIQKKYEEKLGEKKAVLTSGNEGKFIIIQVKPYFDAGDFEMNRALVASVRNIENTLKQDSKYQGVQVGYAGSYVTSIESVDLLRFEMIWISAAVAAILFLILIIYFKRLGAAFLVGAPLGAGIIWTGGCVNLILGHVNIVTAFSVSILAGLGSDYGIYLLARFVAEREKGLSFSNATYLAFGRSGRTIFYAMITTLGAFGALIFSDFDVFVEFGIVGCLGLALNYLAMMLIMPSLLALAHRRKKDPLLLARRFRLNLSFVPFAKVFNTKYSLVTVVLVCIVCGVAAFSLKEQSKIYFEDGQMDNRKIPSNQLYDRIRATLGASLHPSVLMVQGAAEEKKTIEALDQQLTNGDPVVFEKVVGISSFIPKFQEEKREILSRIRTKYPQNRFVNKDQNKKVVSSISETLESGVIDQENLPWEVTRRFVSPVNKDLYAVYVFPAIGREKSEDMARYNAGILEAKRQAGIHATPVDASFISLDIINLIASEAHPGLLSVLLFLSIVLFLTIRQIKRSLMILLNLVGGLILLAGILHLCGIRLNILNIAVFPIILGTGIDCFLHLSHRYDESKNIDDSLACEAPPIFVSNLTSIIGFGGLLFSSSVGVRSIGWVSTIGLILMTLLCLFIFPRCLALSPFKKVEVIEVMDVSEEVA